MQKWFAGENERSRRKFFLVSTYVMLLFAISVCISVFTIMVVNSLHTILQGEVGPLLGILAHLNCLLPSPSAFLERQNVLVLLDLSEPNFLGGFWVCVGFARVGHPSQCPTISLPSFTWRRTNSSKEKIRMTLLPFWS